MRAAIAIAASAFLLGTLPAYGQTPSGDADQDGGQPTKVDPQDRYQRAQRLFIAHRYAEALPMFRQVWAELNSPNALLYVARCLRELGRLPEAYHEMLQTVREASERAATDEDRYKHTWDAARREFGELRSRVGRVTLQIPNPPKGVKVELNGREVPAQRLGQELAVHPGTVKVKVTAPGYHQAEQQLLVSAGNLENVPVVLTPSDQPVPPPDPDTEESGFGLREWGFVTAGVGLAGMLTFAIAGTMANGRYADIEEACGGTQCPDDSYNDDIEGGRRMDIAANVGLGIGIAGLVAGAVMIGVGWPSDEQEPAETAVQFGPMPGGFWLGCHGTF